LRSLQEFRKNPHVKIAPKSSCADFQSLGIFKNSIFIRKGIFFRFRPIRPSPAHAGPLHPAGRRIPARPTRPKPHWRICRKAYSFRLCALRQRRLLSLTSLPCGMPTIAASPHRLRPPRAARPTTSGCQARSSLSALIPLLISPLNPHQAAPPSMALRPLPPAVSPSLAPVCLSPATIKGRGAPPAITTLTLPSFAHSRVRNVHPPRASSTGCSPVSRVRGGVHSPPWTGATRGPLHRGLGPWNFPLKSKSGNSFIPATL
jgi:hypothetical protein